MARRLFIGLRIRSRFGRFKAEKGGYARCSQVIPMSINRG